MAVTTKPVTLSIPAKDSDAAQQEQIADLKFGFERFLYRRRGPLVGLRWKREIAAFLTKPGTTYEQCRARLEADFNKELALTQHELMQIISP